MSDPSYGWIEKKNKIADEEMGEGDFGWTWVVKMWELIANNPTFLEGTLEEIIYKEGILEDIVDIEGTLIEEKGIVGEAN